MSMKYHIRDLLINSLEQSNLLNDLTRYARNEYVLGQRSVQTRIDEELPWCIIKEFINLPIARFKCERQAQLYLEIVPQEAKCNLKLVHIRDL